MRCICLSESPNHLLSENLVVGAYMRKILNPIQILGVIILIAIDRKSIYPESN